MTADAEKKCKEDGCNGFLDANNFIVLQVGGCSSSSLGFYCNQCGRLYRWDGVEPMFGKDGKKLFCKDGKAIAL